MEINKEKIVEIAKNYLNDGYSEEFYEKNSTKKTFFSNLKSLNYTQIKKILTKNSTLSNVKYCGLHSLHYAAQTNDPDIISLFIDVGVKNGLESFPSTDKDTVNYPAKASILTYCTCLNLDKSFAKMLTYMSHPEEQNFNLLYKYAMSYNSPKLVPLFKDLIGEQIQADAFSFYTFRKEEGNKIKTNFYNLFINNFKSNPSVLEDFGVNVLYKEENKRNYFTFTLDCLAENTFNVEEMGEKKFNKIILFFLEKGFCLDEQDGLGDTPRLFIEKIKNNTYKYEIKELIEEKMVEYDKISMENLLKSQNTKKQKKIKI